MIRRLCHTPLGDLQLGASGGRLVHCCWATPSCPSGQVESRGVQAVLSPNDGPLPTDEEVLKMAAAQLMEYMGGRRVAFRLPYALRGTPFQCRVWQALLEVPYGQTENYASLARRIGNPRAVRAVAQACHRNPVAVIVPCHRIIASDGRLCGYAGGIAIKRGLLLCEGVVTGNE